MLHRASLETMGKLFKKKLTGSVEASATVRRDIVDCRTGRSVPASEGWSLAQEWSRLDSMEKLLSHIAAARLRAELASESMPRVAGGIRLCVRGRVDDSKITSWLNMGPQDPPVCGGRYNSPGVIALYLCDSKNGVLRELDPKPGACVFLQEYEIPSQEVRLADCSSDDLTDFMEAVFFMAERCSSECPGEPSDYMFSQVVGQLVRETGFEGVLVPGTRGDGDFRYRNLGIFDKHERWRIWSCQDAGFRCEIAGDAAV